MTDSKRVQQIDKYFQVANKQFRIVSTRIVGVDDALYAKSRELWEELPRGKSQVFGASGELQASIQGLRKFSYMSQHSTLGDLDKVLQFIAMQKENGENAQITAFRYDNKLFWLGGSKNVHIIFQNKDDLELYTDQRYDFARPIAQWCVENLSLEFQQWLAETKFTAVGEAIFGSSQHLVDYGQVGDHVRFFALTKNGPFTGSLTAMSPQDTIAKFKSFNLIVPDIVDTAPYPSQRYDCLVEKIACMQNSEGCVMYGVDDKFHTVYMCKVKSVQYTLERTLREATFRQADEEEIRKTIQQTIQKTTTPADVKAVEMWKESRLEVLLEFSAWLQHCGDGTRDNWISKQHEFKKVQLPDGVKSWFDVVGKSKPGESKRTRVVASRGLPLSGKSTVMRSLQVVMEDLGLQAIWINQDELGNKRNYLRAFKLALDKKVDYVLLDKSNRAIENLQDITDISGPLDCLFNFAHMQDDLDEDDVTLAKEVCCGRHSSRVGHRTIDQDSDIDKILGFMSAMRISRPKLRKKAQIIEDIDITLSQQLMLKRACDTLNLDVDEQTLENALKVSQRYEECMAENENIRHVFFGINMKVNLIPILKQVVPPEAFALEKVPLSKQHVTVAYMGDHVYPAQYVKLFEACKNFHDIPIKMMSIHSDNKATSALVCIKDDHMANLCQNKYPHITLALTKKTPPAYSNELLARYDSEIFRFPADYPFQYGVLVGQGGSTSDQSKRKAQVVVAPQATLPKSMSKVQGIVVASDIGGVLFETWRTSKEDHTINDVNATKCVKDAIESLKLMVEANYDVYLLSYCGEATEQKTRVLLKKFGVDQIVPESKWLFCRKRSQKVEIMKEKGIQCIIDDTREIVWSVRGGGLKAIHFTQENTISWVDVLKQLETYYGNEDLSTPLSKLSVNEES